MIKFPDQGSCVNLKVQLEINRFLEAQFIFHFRTEQFMSYGVISAKIGVSTFEVAFSYFGCVICRFFVVLFDITVVPVIKTGDVRFRSSAGPKLFVLIYVLPMFKGIGYVWHDS